MNLLRKNANMIRELAWSDFKLKYYGSFLGLLWSFLRPVFMLGILYLVFYSFFKVNVEHYVWFLLIGIVFWNFFSDATKDGMQNIVSKAHILKNINISPLIIVISSLLQSFLTFMITLIVLFLILFAFGFYPTASFFLFWFYVALTTILVLGTLLVTIPLSARFKDFGHLWDIFLQMLFWMTPIVYSESLVPASYIKWYLLNPLSRVIMDARTTILYHAFPDPKQIFITLGIVSLILLLGCVIFKRFGKTLTEEL